jgi:hypothetical protein
MVSGSGRGRVNRSQVQRRLPAPRSPAPMLPAPRLPDSLLFFVGVGDDEVEVSDGRAGREGAEVGCVERLGLEG